MVNFNISLQAARQSCLSVDNFGFSANYFAYIVPVVLFSNPQFQRNSNIEANIPS